MLTEEIYLLILKTILSNLLFCLSYLVNKYLNKKPLGMQTILDIVVKDLSKIIMVFASTSWFVYVPVKNLDYAYKNYVSLMIVGLHHLTHIAIIVQSIIFVGLRYLYIFHQIILNNFDDSKIMKCLRLFVSIVCLTLTFIEIPHLEHTVDYCYMMNIEVEKENFKLTHLVIVLILVILGLIGTVFVQVKIELFKKTVDCKSESNQMEAGNAENDNDFEMSKNTMRFVVMLLCLLFILLLDWLLRERLEAENVILSRLRFSVIVQFLSCNVIVILIRRNPKMYEFCVNQINFAYYIRK